ARTAARGSHRWVRRFLTELEISQDVALVARQTRVTFAQIAAEVEANAAFAAKIDTVPGARAQLSARVTAASTAPVSSEEAAARWLEDTQDADLYRIAAYTGLRLGELLALRWG